LWDDLFDLAGIFPGELSLCATGLLIKIHIDIILFASFKRDIKGFFGWAVITPVVDRST